MEKLQGTKSHRCKARGHPVGIQSPDKLEVDALQVPGAAVPAIWEPGAQQAGRAGTGMVLAFPEEGDLEREQDHSLATGKACKCPLPTNNNGDCIHLGTE